MRGSAHIVMTDTQIEVVCDETLSCAQLPLARRSLEPLLSSMCHKAWALHKEGLLPEVPKGVVLALVTDREMAGLNRSAMGVPGPTNILSFPDGEGTAELALDVAQLLRDGAQRVPVTNLTRGFTVEMRLEVTPRQRDMLLEGGLIRMIAANAEK